jgi:hypothetical protein
MTLSLYTLHLLLLSRRFTLRDASEFWLHLAVLLTFAWVWRLWSARGPLEQVLTWSTRGTRRLSEQVVTRAREPVTSSGGASMIGRRSRRWAGGTACRDDGRVALVYRGPAALPGCPEAVADLLRQSRWGFTVAFVGPKEARGLGPDALAGAVLYAQPGGGELGPAWRKMRAHSRTVQGFVRDGGKYLGFCLGTYLAGASPGLRPAARGRRPVPGVARCRLPDR